MIERLGQKGTRRWAGARRPKAPARELAYNELKATWQRAIVAWLRREWGTPRTLLAPIALACTFFELDRHRDPDGVAMGAVKLLLDAMVAGRWLTSDGASTVRQLGPFLFRYPGEDGPALTSPLPPAIVVNVFETGGRDSVALLPLRLPDWNELREAVELGVRRQLRKAVRP